MKECVWKEKSVCVCERRIKKEWVYVNKKEKGNEWVFEKEKGVKGKKRVRENEKKEKKKSVWVKEEKRVNMGVWKIKFFFWYPDLHKHPIFRNMQDQYTQNSHIQVKKQTLQTLPEVFWGFPVFTLSKKIEWKKKIKK
jgi:hypothetical protein